jgi:hypothetical protein
MTGFPKTEKSQNIIKYLWIQLYNLSNAATATVNHCVVMAMHSLDSRGGNPQSVSFCEYLCAFEKYQSYYTDF